MKKNLEDKRNKVILGIGSICVLVIVMAVSYAYIAYYNRQKGINVIESECIQIEMEELSDAINLKGAYPISNESVEKLKPFTFKLTNTCTMNVDYNINLEVLEVENRMPSHNVGIKLDEEEIKTLTAEIETKVIETEEYQAVESYRLGTSSLKPKESKTHNLKVWLHESADNASQNKVFQSKVVIEGTQSLQAIWNFSDYLIDLSKSEDRGIEKIDHEATEQTPALTDYRYTGSNPNNYVYFGCEGDTCTEDHLYRIIGVIPTQSSENGTYENRVKLIKANYYIENESGYLKENLPDKVYAPGGQGYYWNRKKEDEPNQILNNHDKWEESTLQKEVLNKIYWNSLENYQSYIEQAKWYLGASSWYDREIYISEQFYQNERSNTQGKSKGTISYIAPVGLMYPSDYGFSIDKSFWKQSIYSNAENYKNLSWLYTLKNGEGELLISVESSYSDDYTRAWQINFSGSILGAMIGNYENILGIRPTFYLKADVLYSSGDGTRENPYRVGL